MDLVRIFIVFCLLGQSFPVWSQIRLSGNIMDAKDREPLAYVNIGIRNKNIGTAAQGDGTFSIRIPQVNVNDTLTFSMVGYDELDVPIIDLVSREHIRIHLNAKTVELHEFTVSEDKLVEKKHGIKRRNLLVHFSDGMFWNHHDIFEIGQLIKLGDSPVQVTSVNLHINAPRNDSALFRINFYRYDEEDNRPGNRLVEKSIIQRHPIHKGWLRMDLTAHNILLKEKFIAALEFIPESPEELEPVYYEVKLGGLSKSFYRRNSLGEWNSPPHHYCMFITTLEDRSTPDEPDDEESLPAFTMYSEGIKDTFSIFVDLPSDYDQNNPQKYPVIYLLDANAYFDPVRDTKQRLSQKKKLDTEPILVGIGYGDAYLMDSLRIRDYTFPEMRQENGFSRTGGGERFHDFIRKELIPRIDATYQTDTTARTIMGHSLGGYFSLYALLRDLHGEPLFHNYVAASPSIGYHDNYIVRQFEKTLTDTTVGVSRKLFITSGGLELEEDVEGIFKNFIRFLSKQDFLETSPKIYKKMEHMGTAIPSLEEGVEFVMKK